MKEFSITMTVAVNATVFAKTKREAIAMALGSPADQLSEFDRTVDRIEDITPKPPRRPRTGIGSY